MKRLIGGWLLLWTHMSLAQMSPAEPTVEIGAAVFLDRCVLCHGDRGMGDGNLAIRLDDYPNTNLLENALTTSHTEIRDAIAFGGSKGSMSNYMPPMGADMTWTETESAALFVALLRERNEEAVKLLRIQAMKNNPDVSHGRDLFLSRCQLCHGKSGEGDGRMSKIIKSPPPANLVMSTLTDAETLRIIIAGGEPMNRSPQMPPWGDQLSQGELQSLLLYLRSIRKK